MCHFPSSYWISLLHNAWNWAALPRIACRGFPSVAAHVNNFPHKAHTRLWLQRHVPVWLPADPSLIPSDPSNQRLQDTSRQHELLSTSHTNVSPPISTPWGSRLFLWLHLHLRAVHWRRLDWQCRIIWGNCCIALNTQAAAMIVF